MKKSTIIILCIVGVIILWGVSVYNQLVNKEESVETKWANVESAYQRRADLIPNLVATVKGYAEHEEGTLTAVIEARAKATAMNISADNLTEENIQAFQAAQDQLSSAVSRLLVSVEQYPDLKANENFLELQSQLESTENRINIARQNFNEIVKDFNQSVRRFPGNIIASMFGFEKKAYFKAAAGSEVAPKVQF